MYRLKRLQDILNDGTAEVIKRLKMCFVTGGLLDLPVSQKCNLKVKGK